MHELRGAAEPSLAELLGKLSKCDLVTVEGFEREPIPKIEIGAPRSASRFFTRRTPPSC